MSRPPHRRPSDHVQIAGRSDLDLAYAAALSSEQRDEALARLGSMTADRESPFAASIGSKADDEHDTEGRRARHPGPEHRLRTDQLSALIRHAQAHLSDVDDTTARLPGGRYGICEACHEHIPGRTAGGQADGTNLHSARSPMS